MTHTIKQRTFEFEGMTFIKGINTLSKEDAVQVFLSSAKILYSRIIDGDIAQSPVTQIWASNYAIFKCKKNVRALINKVGDQLYTIIYEQEAQ